MRVSRGMARAAEAASLLWHITHRAARSGTSCMVPVHIPHPLETRGFPFLASPRGSGAPMQGHGSVQVTFPRENTFR